ncbi:hypothetical protein A311_02022 [Escherichia coli KTE146]|nr:hypothetical protein A311_02022 [Escherichia coli KTE146]
MKACFYLPDAVGDSKLCGLLYLAKVKIVVYSR